MSTTRVGLKSFYQLNFSKNNRCAKPLQFMKCWLTENNNYLSPSVSPDGKYVLFAYLDDAKSMIQPAVVELENPKSEPRIFPDVETFIPSNITMKGRLEWLPDSRTFACLYEENSAINLRAVPIDGSAPYSLTNFTNDQYIFEFAVSPDGKYLAVSRGKDSTDVVLIKISNAFV